MDTEARDGHRKGTMSVEIRDRASIGIQEPQERRCNSSALDRHRSWKVQTGQGMHQWHKNLMISSFISRPGVDDSARIDSGLGNGLLMGRVVVVGSGLLVDLDP
ncbi:hypothetical protein HN51_007917 [Arachis hypogaea]